MVTVVDPDAIAPYDPDIVPNYTWDNPYNEHSFIGVLTGELFSRLCKMIMKHTMPDRVIRTIRGAIANALPPLPGAPQNDLPVVQITDSEELEGWLANTTARLQRVLAILHREQAGFGESGNESPPSHQRFPHIEETDYSILDIPAEDPSFDPHFRVTNTGCRVNMPRTFESFQRIIQEYVVRRDRQQDGITHLEPIYLRKFPDAVCVGDPNFQLGKIWTQAEIVANRAADRNVPKATPVISGSSRASR